MKFCKAFNGSSNRYGLCLMVKKIEQFGTASSSIRLNDDMLVQCTLFCRMKTFSFISFEQKIDGRIINEELLEMVMHISVCILENKVCGALQNDLG